MGTIGHDVLARITDLIATIGGEAHGLTEREPDDIDLIRDHLCDIDDAIGRLHRALDDAERDRDEEDDE